MRWMLIALLVSLAALLIAAAGLARHIWLYRARLRSKPPADAEKTLDSSQNQDEETRVDAER
jgi:hypothetical protein